MPRHEQIVGRILNQDNSRLLTILIGSFEIAMAVWILSNFRSKINAIAQIIIVALMNSIEFILVPDLLLWGKANTIFAGILIAVIYINEFVLKKKMNV